eukprot:4385504-Pyramimonas_sp.AAC.1
MGTLWGPMGPHGNLCVPCGVPWVAFQVAMGSDACAAGARPADLSNPCEIRPTSRESESEIRRPNGPEAC